MNDFMTRGVYFNLSFDEYLAEPSLSSSGIKSLLISPLTYWTQCLDPNRESRSTKSQDLGRALHKMLLEGERAFNSEYAVLPEPGDFPGCIQSGKELQQVCGDFGLKKSGTIMNMALRILSVAPEVLIFPVILQNAQRDAEMAGKEPLKKSIHQACLKALQTLRTNSAATAALTSGIPEVSVFFEIGGVKFKARFDYLKPQAIIDLKSFSNQGLPLDKTIIQSMLKYQYHVQACLYIHAGACAHSLAQQGQIFGANPGEVVALTKMQQHLRFFFIFSETGVTKNVVVREMLRTTDLNSSKLWDVGTGLIEKATNIYKDNMRKYGLENPWVSENNSRAFMDEELPAWLHVETEEDCLN